MNTRTAWVLAAAAALSMGATQLFGCDDSSKNTPPASSPTNTTTPSATASAASPAPAAADTAKHGGGW